MHKKIKVVELFAVVVSDGIFTFNKTKKILQEFQKVISVPVWLIGIDIKIN